MGDDLRRLLVAEPLVVVGTRQAVQLATGRPTVGDGWLGGGGGDGVGHAAQRTGEQGHNGRVHVDLNADLGEEITDDESLLAVVSSANVACGYHAGSVAIMRAVCERAAELGVSVGAQVSYADRENFGRVSHDVPEAVLREQVLDQVGTLATIAEAAGTRLRYVKPHGALYHRVLDDAAQARAVLAGSGDLPVLGMVPGALVDLAHREGRRVHAEAFPDRGYTPQGRLLPRGEPGALVTSAMTVAQRAVELAGRPQVDSLCLHGDSPGAVETARRVRVALEAAGWALRGL